MQCPSFWDSSVHFDAFLRPDLLGGEAAGGGNLLQPDVGLSKILWTFIYNGTIWYYLILNLML